MSPDQGPRDVERLLRSLPVTPAPDGLWERVQAELKSRGTLPPAVPRLRVNPWLATAAAAVAVLLGSVGGFLFTYRAPLRWTVQAVEGAPVLGGVTLTGEGKLAAGLSLVTDARSRAELAVGRIGRAEVGPNSRVELERGGFTEHRLTLERGTLEVAIAAPPRLFFVRTPSALATDLGCAYALDVDSAGSSRLHVTAGWVELGGAGPVAMVPAGLVAEVAVGGRPGTPYPEGFPADARAALHRLDDGSGGDADLDLVLGALHRPTDFITLRQQSAITLWHLVQRVTPELRGRVYQRLAALSAPPAGVTREGILALDRPMLTRWLRTLSPMWSDEAQSWWTRLGRRLWDWTLR
jgi:hypothetical protein